MKKVNLRQALEELKQAKSLAQRLTATSNLVNQTAYKAGQFLYGSAETQSKPDNEKTKPAFMPKLVATPSVEPAVTPTSAAPKQNLPDEEVDYFTKGLMKLNEELKALRLAKEKAESNVEKNAVHFKILRLERTRREYLAKNQNHSK